MKRSISYIDFRKRVMARVQAQMAALTHPKEEPPQQCFMAGPGGIRTLSVHIDGFAMTSETFASRIIPATLYRERAYMVALALNSWILRDPDDSMTQAYRHGGERAFSLPSTSDEREEGIFLDVVSAYEQQRYIALIERHEDQPPTIGEFVDERTFFNVPDGDAAAAIEVRSRYGHLRSVLLQNQPRN